MDLLQVAQQIFFEVAKTSNSTFTPSEGGPIPLDIPSLLISLFFSSSAIREWGKLFFYGSILEILRRSVLYLYNKAFSSFFISATFAEEDISYSWVCHWLSLQHTWRKARDIHVSTKSFRDSGLSFDDDERSSERTITLLPSDDIVHTMWYHGHWMRIRRYTRDAEFGRKHRYLELSIFARSHTVLNNILDEAKKGYQEIRKSKVNVYASNRYENWTLVASRPKRSFDSIILDPGTKDILLNDAKDFLSSKAWYTARGIPFRRGYLLHGAPGSGKTSFIQSLAGELNLDLYIISLSKSGMDDGTLSELVLDLPEKCIALMEDIDAAFSRTFNRESNDEQSDADSDSEKVKKKRSSNPPEPVSKVTLSGLLNILDGVAAQEGRILFATTNKYDALDPALCRPGRMDVHLEFMLASKFQAKGLFKCFYTPDSDLNEEKEADSGYATPNEEEKEKKSSDAVLVDGVRSTIPTTTNTNTNTTTTTRRLSVDELEKLADEFAELIPERELSMAGLQGFLMAHKATPRAALREVVDWVMKQREERTTRKQDVKKERRKDKTKKESETDS